MKVRLLYLARLREALGSSGEEAVLPKSVENVGDLLAWLQGRGGAYRDELASGRAYRVAVNQEMGTAATRLAEGDEVAIFPSGHRGLTMAVRVQVEDFDAGAEIARLREGDAKVGAVVCFVGVVRDLNDGDAVSTLTLEHYPGMTERSIEAIVDESRSRWALLDVIVIHRVGTLRPTDQIVLVAVSSSHRGEAFAACEFLMDYLKTRAPFWKKEQTPGGGRWVEARASDDVAAARWAEPDPPAVSD